MTVTEESGGRLNAFAKEPEIEVISEETSNSKRFQQIAVLVSIFLIGTIGFSLVIK